MKTINSLNAVCPYHTMFPIDFPMRILRGMKSGQVVADPFAGRGTTLYAAREKGLIGYGIDTSIVAAAISRAKIASATPEEVLQAYDALMLGVKDMPMPEGKFWKVAFHPETLQDLCRIRESLMRIDSPEESGAVSILRAICLGAMHGPLRKGEPSYFSNQMPRTFAPKPDYAIKFWRQRELEAPHVSIRSVIEARAKRLLKDVPKQIIGSYVCLGDSTRSSSFARLPGQIDCVITSPPYYGMRTYEQDQWIRLWFLGGDDKVSYKTAHQLSHAGQQEFARSLSEVWNRIAENASPRLKMAVRFGAIHSLSTNYIKLLKDSLALSCADWRITAIRSAGGAEDGRRQALHMGEKASSARSITERDFYITLSS